jgi:hypothetical protein
MWRGISANLFRLNNFLEFRNQWNCNRLKISYNPQEIQDESWSMYVGQTTIHSGEIKKTRHQGGPMGGHQGGHQGGGRLGEFPPIGQSFALGSFLKMLEAGQIFGHYFGKKCVGLHFGRFFHKLIWSPCSPLKMWTFFRKIDCVRTFTLNWMLTRCGKCPSDCQYVSKLLSRSCSTPKPGKKCCGG